MIEIFKKQLQNGEYFHGSNWSFDWYIDDIFCKAMAYGNMPVFLGYSQAVVGDEFLSTDTNQKIIDRFNNFFDSPIKVNELISNQNLIMDEAKILIGKIENDKEINLSNYYDIQYKLSLLMASVSVVFDGLIESKIKEIGDNDNVSDFELSAYIIDQSSITKLNESSNKLLELYRKNKNIEASDLKSHAKEFGWLNTGERGKAVWNENDFFKQLQGLKAKITSKHSTRPKLSKENQIILDNIIKINQNDNVASDLQVELDFLFQKFLKIKLGNQYDEKIIEQLTFKEIAEVVNNTVAIDNFRERKNNFDRVLFPHNNDSISLYLSKTEFEEVKSLISNPSDDNKLVISGSVACQGNVSGKVRLIQNLSDLKDFQKGEIIVASMTQPSYTPYMIEAIAIITDVGGITSHAAIISREFNIPCIVGTQNATKILKTGDYIKVDTEKGVVEKISE